MSTKASGGARNLAPLKWEEKLPEPIVIEHGVEGFAMWLRAFRDFNPDETGRVLAQLACKPEWLAFRQSRGAA